jgi:hypothetical protein
MKNSLEKENVLYVKLVKYAYNSRVNVDLLAEC